MRGLDVRYIHQRPGWPHFTWRESELLPLLPEIRHRQGRLLGRMVAETLSQSATKDLSPEEKLPQVPMNRTQ